MLADLREALRQLRKAPGVTTTAVVTLALGIGATTAIFTLVHQVMLKSLPVMASEELAVAVFGVVEDAAAGFSCPASGACLPVISRAITR